MVPLRARWVCFLLAACLCIAGWSRPATSRVGESGARSGHAPAQIIARNCRVGHARLVEGTSDEPARDFAMLLATAFTGDVALEQAFEAWATRRTSPSTASHDLSRARGPPPA